MWILRARNERDERGVWQREKGRWVLKKREWIGVLYWGRKEWWEEEQSMLLGLRSVFVLGLVCFVLFGLVWFGFLMSDYGFWRVNCEVAYYYTKTVKRESDLLQSGQKRKLAEPPTWRYLVGLFVFVFSLLLN